MKKKIIAVVLSVILLLSCPLTVLASSFRIPSFNEIVTAVQADLHSKAEGLGKLAKLNVSLLRSLTEKAGSIQIAAADTQSVFSETSVLLAGIYDTMGSNTSMLLNGPAKENGSRGESSGAPAQTSLDAGGDTPELPADPAESITFADLSQVLKKYLFVKVDNADEIAALIAQSCEFTYTTLQSGDGTIYIRVDIEKNPQIFNYAVFRHLVEDLYAQQGEELLKNGGGDVNYLMSYEHIAGELALHALIYAASNEFLRVTGSHSSRILSLYKSAAQADLNIDEARVPSELLFIFGAVLMNSICFRVLSAFGLI